MKFKLRINYLIALFLFVAFGQAHQVGELTAGNYKEPGSTARFIDNNRDGYNDLASDSDHDGIPDLLDKGSIDHFIDPEKYDFHEEDRISCTLEKQESTRQCCSSH